MKASGIVPGPYRPRIVDAQVDRYLRLFGAVEVSGTKWCGKTWTSLAHASSVTYVDRGANLQITQADPSYALAGEQPHVIDEWQRVPAIWDTVRHAVDELGGSKGAWILTGSSTPERSKTSHSGAGRIGRVRMHPMTLQESGDSTGAISLSKLFDGEFTPCQCPNGIENLAQLICRGGWPEELSADPDDAQIVIREYLEAIHEQSIPHLGGSSALSRRVSLSLARNLCQSATQATLARDVYNLETDAVPSDVQKRALAEHIGLLIRLFLVDEVPGWVPATRSPKRMRVKPKRYFADPSLAVALLGLSVQSLLQDWQTLGLAFENLCMRDLDVYARALPDTPSQPLRYYHDDSGLEVDAIIERADGRWGAFEIKLSEDKIDQASCTLTRMRNKVLKDPRERVREPSFLAVLTGMGEVAYRRADGIYVIPIRALGA
ncbi:MULTISPECIES: ATP-binding protein [unclassified Adlercreutzia]|uniref:ATP-binding protein n=1 Tax=unclassified Adlercreutzia TaxID=2636013 RepID=UPI0013ECEBDA|nr:MULTISPECIES: DUF4143 domain-containing protein [unclassified Adlercreutzia]